jgi:DNA-binding CsgD family transcriptional regulator
VRAINTALSVPGPLGQRGVYTGRKPALTAEQAKQLRERAAGGARKATLAKEFGISRETVYSYRDGRLAGVPPQ